MPAPAVYVLAIVGTVGAVLAFKEFVYEPHIAPAIDRWYVEFQAKRRQRQRQAAAVAAAVHSDVDDGSDVPMSETTRNIRKPISKPPFADDTDTSSSDDESSTSGVLGNRLMKGGLLRRSPEQQGYERLHDNVPAIPRPHPPVIELDDLVAREVREWRNGPSGSTFPAQSLRQRKNADASVAEHDMDESIHTIPYVPMSPSSTHVLFDSSSSPVSTPTSSGSRVASPPLPPLPPSGPSPPPTLPPPHPLSISMTAGDASSPDIHHLSEPQASLPTPALSPPPAFARQATSSPLTTMIPSPRFGSPFQQSIEQSPLFSNHPPPTATNVSSAYSTPDVYAVDLSSLEPSRHSSSPAASAAIERNQSLNLPPLPPSPSPPQTQAEARPQISASSIYSQSIPSLSQSYPQDLDYEHGLELLSAPSSRSMSPFSMAGMSPNLGPADSPRFGNGQGQGPWLRVLSPSSPASSAFSSVLSSPAMGPGTGRSPLAMELGNDSVDVLSSAHRDVQLEASPAAAPPHSVNVSATSSARSTTYLSFDDDSSDSERGSPVWPLRLSAPSQPIALPRAAGTGSGSLLFMDDSMATSGQAQTPTQESLLASTPHASLTVPRFSARSPLVPPQTPPAQAQSTPQSQHPRSPEPDSLLDLDFLSDSSASEFEFEYAPSEPSDLGNESAGEGSRPGSQAGRSEVGSSDGWSMPDAAGSPPPGPPSSVRAGRDEASDRMATIRGGRRFGWR